MIDCHFAPEPPWDSREYSLPIIVPLSLRVCPDRFAEFIKGVMENQAAFVLWGTSPLEFSAFDVSAPYEPPQAIVDGGPLVSDLHGVQWRYAAEEIQPPAE